RHNTTSHAVDFEVYNTSTDPKETTNLAGQPGVPTQQEFRDAVLRVRRPNSSAPRAYDNETVPSLPLATDRAGVAWRAFEESFAWVPDFDGLTPAASGETTSPDISVRTRDDDIGIEFTGYLDVPATGDYTFYLNADTGAFLRLHQMQVIDADFGYTGSGERSSTVKLEAGLHPFTLGYRRGTGGTPALSLSWSGPSIAKQAIPPSAFAVTAVASAPPPSQWLLEEGSGTTTSETRSGTVSDPFGTGVTWSTVTPGPLSTASISFPGTSSGNFGTNLDAADLGIDGSGAKTITAWIRSTHSGSTQMFFGWTPSNGLNAGQDIRIGLDENGMLRLEVTGGFARYDTIPLNDGLWHMVGLVVEPGDTTSTVQFYIDGALVDPSTSSAGLIDTAATGPAPRDELYLGIGNIGGNQPWSGDLDEVSIDAEVLTEAQLDARLTAMTAQPSPVEWPLDEASGITTSESKTGTVSDAFGSGVAWSADTPGPGSPASVSFTGSEGIGTNLDAAAAGIDGSGAKTISAWIKTGTASDTAFFGYSPTGGGTPGADLRLLVNAAGQLRFEANSGNYALSSAIVNDNAWHFVSLVIPPNSTTADVSFYLDGILAAPGTAGGTATLNTATGNEIRIGTDGSAGRHFNGLIDHVRIHDRALDLAELDALRGVGIDTGFASWIESFFPGETDPAIIGFDSDPDHDSMANGLEYYLGGDNDPSVAPEVALPAGIHAGNGFEFHFTRRDAAEVSGISVVVEAGGDLQSWPQTFMIGADSASSSPGVEISENGDADDTITVTIPIAESRLFVRLRASWAP
ncbi:MAG: hypothetical protein KDN05_09380, partial [Verrucomicrobiae bacterium]|nr:hypothetical protein [Verrucomicrobiae bacterium]